MPGPLTHLLFAQSLIPTLVEIFPFLASYKEEFKLGSLGPDPFYFFGSLQFQHPDKAMAKKLGSQFHLDHPLKTFLPLLKTAHGSFQEKNIFFSYLLGFITHYVLDVVMHPYVFYHSGFNEFGSIDSMPYRADHIRLEHSLDLAFLQEAHTKIEDYNVTNQLNLQTTTLLVIDSLYHHAFGVQLGLFSEGFSTMKKLYHLVYDPGRWKRTIIKTLFKKRSFIYAITHDTFLTKEKFESVTNLKKRVWIHPSSLQPYSYSVFDLKNWARQKIMPFFSMMFDLFHQENFSWAQLAHFFEDVNFDGDRIGTTKQIFQSIYLDKPDSLKASPIPSHVQD